MKEFEKFTGLKFIPIPIPFHFLISN